MKNEKPQICKIESIIRINNEQASIKVLTHREKKHKIFLQL